jgi:hypothetical protein
MDVPGNRAGITRNDQKFKLNFNPFFYFIDLKVNSLLNNIIELGQTGQIEYRISKLSREKSKNEKKVMFRKRRFFFDSSNPANIEID